MVQVHLGPQPEPAGSGGFFDPWGRRHRGTAPFQSMGHPSARLRVRLGSRGDHLPLLRAREPGRCEVLHGVRDAARSAPARRRRRGTQGRHGAVLRPRRVHRHLGVGRPRGRRPDARGLLRDGARRRSRPTAAWWRSSSGTPSSGSSGCPRPTRTIPSARCARASGSARTPSELEAVGGAPLKLRVGINTGEALVRLGIAPRSGEGFLAGDAINTASRIQSVAPEMGVAVGLGTYEATAPVFDYEELEPATLKGKSEPVRVFHAQEPARPARHRPHPHPRHPVRRSRDRPGAAQGHLRQDGRRELAPARHRRRRARSRQEPDRRRARRATSTTEPELITWRQGRCLPYGEGITFWALGEIVKAHAGILESDPPDVADRQARGGAPRGRGAPVVPPAAAAAARDRGDLHRRTRGAVHRVAPVPRAHRRAAIRPCSCSRTCTGPTTRCSRSSSTSPTGPRRAAARRRHRPPRALRTPPRLRQRTAERHADQPRRRCRRRRPRASSPRCSRPTVIPAELQQPILDRAGGNPLYAEEFVRLLQGQGPARQARARAGSCAKAPRSRSRTRCRR